MQIELIPISDGINTISMENRGADYAFTWNSTQPENSFLIVVCYGNSLISGEDMRDHLSKRQLPQQSEWTEENEIKIHHLSATSYMARNGTLISKSAIPSPAKIIVFYVKDGSVLLHDGVSNQITIKKTISYKIRKCFKLNIFSSKRKYLIFLQIEGRQSLGSMSGLISCKVSRSVFPFSKKCFDEAIEVVSDRGITPQLILAENVKQYYALREQEKD